MEPLVVTTPQGALSQRYCAGLVASKEFCFLKTDLHIDAGDYNLVKSKDKRQGNATCNCTYAPLGVD